VDQTELLIATAGLVAGVLMVRIAGAKRMVEFRRRPALCVSCGRSYVGRVCPWCARA
jgi:hypothetical protein